MKKTLITLAALAAASVASAATLDFTQPSTLPTAVTFNGNATDVITLSGTVQTTDSAILYGDDFSKSITINGSLFGVQYGTSGVLSGATIDFGTDGRMDVGYALTMGSQNLAFNATLDFEVITDNVDDIGKTVIVSRTLLTSTSSMWNVMEGDFCTNTFEFSSATDGVEVNSLGFKSGKNDSHLTDQSVGSLYYSGTDGKTIEVFYVAKYVAAPASIPEPATATLSLLALAGLAARRRRK